MPKYEQPKQQAYRKLRGMQAKLTKLNKKIVHERTVAAKEYAMACKFIGTAGVIVTLMLILVLTFVVHPYIFFLFPFACLWFFVSAWPMQLRLDYCDCTECAAELR